MAFWIVTIVRAGKEVCCLRKIALLLAVVIVLLMPVNALAADTTANNRPLHPAPFGVPDMKLQERGEGV